MTVDDMLYQSEKDMEGSKFGRLMRNEENIAMAMFSSLKIPWLRCFFGGS